MYQRFKDSLLKPSRISNYIDDSKGKTLCFFILLLFIYILPSLVSIISVSKMPSNYSDQIVESFRNSEIINYELVEENEITVLRKTKEDAIPQYVDLGNILDTELKTLVMFNTEQNFDVTKYNFPDSLANKTVILVIFDIDGVAITIGLIDESSVNKDVSELASNTNTYGLFITYEKLGIKNIDFSNATINSTMFKQQLNESYVSMYNSNKVLSISKFPNSVYNYTI